MVYFRTLATAALAAFAVPAFAAVTPAQVVDSIRAITTKFQALQAPAQQINITNGPLIVDGQGPFPQIIVGFSDIITTVTAYIEEMQGSAPVPAGAEADAIYDAFREFVRVQQAFLNILIGKAGIFPTGPLIGEPVAATLRSLENVVDTIAVDIINVVQSREADLTAQANSLAETIVTAINAYNALIGKRDEASSLSKRAVAFAA